MRVAILAGESSGDLLGAKLIQQLKQACPSMKFEGGGGPAMVAAGCRNLFDIEKLAVMGFIEPLKRLPSLIKLRHDLYRHFLKHKTDLFIGIDAPDFNLGLEMKLRRAGIPVVHYISPSVWAWRQRRVHKIAKAVDLMLTLFPFEAKFYQDHDVPVHYTGHPLAQQIPLQPDKLAARRALCIDENHVYVTLLPGSRRQELNYMSEPFLLAAKRVLKRYPHVKFLTSHVNELRYQEFRTNCQRYAPELPITFFTRRSQDVMAAADVVVVTSGTATLETMLFKKPMIIAYRMSSFTHLLAKILVKIPYVGLPNILAGEFLVPELIQKEANPDKIANLICDYLAHPDKVQKLVDRYTVLHQELIGDPSHSVAEPILAMLAEKGKLPKTS